MDFKPSNNRGLLLLILALTCLLFSLIVPATRGRTACPLTSSATAYSWFGASEELPEAYNVLLSCSQITDLKLSFHEGGCVGGLEPWAFNFRDGDKFPTLQNLSIDMYDFETFGPEPLADALPPVLSAYATEARRWLPGPLGPQHNRNLEKWLRAMDWTQLERLDISAYRSSTQDYFWTRMKHELPSLKHLTAQAPFSEALFEFLESVPALETLSIHSSAAITSSNDTSSVSCAAFHLERLLQRHGATLQNLRLSQGESYTVNERRIACNAADIRQLRTLCPHLTHLTLDLDRNGSWPEAEFKELAALEQVASLHLTLELGANLHLAESGEYYWNPQGITTGGPFREPRMNATVAENLFRRLRDIKTGQDLTHLEIEIGYFDAPRWTGPLYLPSWDEGRARKFVCDAPFVSDNEATLLFEGVPGGPQSVPACRILGDEYLYDLMDWV